MFRRINLFFVLVFSLISFSPASAAEFLVQPYLQLGYESKSDASTATINWFTTLDEDKSKQHLWRVEVKSGNSPQFREAEFVLQRLVALPGFAAPIEKYTAKLTRLTPGASFTYRITDSDKEVFSATAMAKKSADQPYKVTIFGDCGANTDGQREIAHQVYKAKPDLVVIPGDIVYRYGLYNEYLSKFFPVYNQDTVPNAASKELSVPLLRSTFSVGVLGNHDIALDTKGTNFENHPDAMAFFLFWNQPLNGFGTKYGARNTPPVAGEETKIKLFEKSVGEAYPQMANFSFDFGNSHWTVLDGNYYMDWTDPATRKWLEDDLKAAQKATWRFVTYHQPAFSIDLPHRDEQRMRLISDILAKYKVDLVYAGHAHVYERSFPLSFGPKSGEANLSLNSNGTVSGALTLDHEYDGVTKTVPRGIIHIVTGAGGAPLHLKGFAADYIDKFISSVHSFTEMQVQGKTLTIKQIDSSGKIIDQFIVSK